MNLIFFIFPRWNLWIYFWPPVQNWVPTGALGQGVSVVIRFYIMKLYEKKTIELLFM